MIKQKHLIWIICANVFFSFLNIGSQSNFIIALKLYSENSSNVNNEQRYAPSNFLFSVQQIRFHFIILSIIVDCLSFILNTTLLIFLYKYPYTSIIHKFNFSNFIFLPLKLVFSIASHIQNSLTFDADNISIYCISTSNSGDSKSACNVIFSQKFFLVFQYIVIFFCGCSIFSFKYYYNIFIKQQSSAQQPISQELQVPFSNEIQSMKKGSKCNSVSYTTRSTTKKGSIFDLEMCNQNINQKSPVMSSQTQANKSHKVGQNIISQNEQNYLSNLVLPVDFNNSQVILHTQNFLYKSYPKISTETCESQQSESNQQQTHKPFTSSLFMFDKKNKSNPLMEKHPENNNSNDQNNSAQRGSVSSQRSSIVSQNLSQISNFNPSFSHFTQSAYSASSPKRFSLNLYKCTAEASQNPIKIFCKLEQQMQQSVILTQPSQNQRSNPQQGSTGEFYEASSSYECYSPTNNTFERSPQNLNNKNDNQKNIFINSQQLQLIKSESEQIYEVTNESEASCQSSSGHSSSINTPDVSTGSLENQNDLNSSPNKYFRTDKTKINPLAVAPSTAIVGHSLSTTAASQMVNALDSVLKQNQHSSVNPISNFVSRLFQSVVK
ncbi:hypothetical protein ABPG74_010010 [Tetrahymena malaccensis]